MNATAIPFAFAASALLLGALLAGCANLPAGDPISQIPVGSRMVINRAITFAPGEYSRYIQDGQLVYGHNPLRPYCRLRLRSVDSQRPTTLSPATYEVIYAYSERLEVASVRSPGPFYAAVVPDPISGDDRGLLTYATRLRLEEPSPLYELFCGLLQPDELRSDFLTAADIQLVLGDLVRLEL